MVFGKGFWQRNYQVAVALAATNVLNKLLTFDLLILRKNFFLEFYKARLYPQEVDSTRASAGRRGRKRGVRG